MVFNSPKSVAQVHLICLAKRLGLHSMTDVKETAEDEVLLGHLLVTAAQVAKGYNMPQGYRIVNNTGKNGH